MGFQFSPITYVTYLIGLILINASMLYLFVLFNFGSSFTFRRSILRGFLTKLHDSRISFNQYTIQFLGPGAAMIHFITQIPLATVHHIGILVYEFTF